MEFKDAEVLLAGAILSGYPPLMLDGSNGIGKTFMLKSMANFYADKKVKFTTAIDYGGLKQFIQLQDIDTIILSDIQTVLSRKYVVMESTLGFVSTLVEEGVTEEITFSKLGRGIESKKLNFIIGGTPRHIVRLVRCNQIDLLSRFVYVPVERDMSKVDVTKPYPLQQLPKDIAKEMLLDWTLLADIQVSDDNVRYKKMLNSIYLNTLAMGFTSQYANLLLTKVRLFVPPEDTDYSWNKLYPKLLKPAKSGL